jgi:hypothetical protein
MQLPMLNMIEKRPNKTKIAKINYPNQITEHLAGVGGDNIGRRVELLLKLHTGRWGLMEKGSTPTSVAGHTPRSLRLKMVSWDFASIP